MADNRKKGLIFSFFPKGFFLFEKERKACRSGRIWLMRMARDHVPNGITGSNPVSGVMKYGISVWYGDKPLEKIFEVLSNYGFDYVEIFLCYPFPEKITENLNKLKREYGLDIAFHAPCSGIHLSHPRKEISDAALIIMKKCIKFASKFSPLYFNFHQSVEVETFEFEEVRKDVFAVTLKSTKNISELCRKFNIPVTIENNSSPFFGTPKQLKSIFKNIHDINFCFDVGHVVKTNWKIRNYTGCLVKEKSTINNWFKVFNRKILLVHLHDCLIENNEEPKDHLIFGNGSLDIEKICKMIKKTSCKYVTIETIFREKWKKRALKNDLKNELDFCKTIIED